MSERKGSGRGGVALIDLHVYGGALLLAVGVGLWQTWAGLSVFGAVLLALGLRRP